MSRLLQVWALPAALLAAANLSATWYNLVSENVPEPYLVRTSYQMAKRQMNLRADTIRMKFFMCRKRKDTATMTSRGTQRSPLLQACTLPLATAAPPLISSRYLASLLIEVIAGCETSVLRALNSGAICIICLVAYQILRSVRTSPSLPIRDKDAQANSGNDWSSLLDAHSALNISLFPPLFFFSALYYTDVMSTLVVMLSYYVFVSEKNAPRKLAGGLTTIVIGVAALSFRQTNVVWVAAFPAGLAVTEALKKDQDPRTPVAKTMRESVRSAWSRGQIHDSFIQDAELEGESRRATADAILTMARLPLVDSNSLSCSHWQAAFGY